MFYCQSPSSLIWGSCPFELVMCKYLLGTQKARWGTKRWILNFLPVRKRSRTSTWKRTGVWVDGPVLQLLFWPYSLSPRSSLLPYHLAIIQLPNCPKTLQEMVWWSISSYFKEHAPPEAQKRCKNIAQKKKYVCDVLKMPLQFVTWMCIPLGGC